MALIAIIFNTVFLITVYASPQHVIDAGTANAAAGDGGDHHGDDHHGRDGGSHHGGELYQKDLKNIFF